MGFQIWLRDAGSCGGPARGKLSDYRSCSPGAGANLPPGERRRTLLNRDRRFPPPLVSFVCFSLFGNRFIRLSQATSPLRSRTKVASGIALRRQRRSFLSFNSAQATRAL